jgi:hypothetical protein
MALGIPRILSAVVSEGPYKTEPSRDRISYSAVVMVPTEADIHSSHKLTENRATRCDATYKRLK